MRFGGVGLLAQTWANKLSPARAVASLLDSLLLGPDSHVHVLTWVGESVVFSHFAGPVAGRLERIAFVARGQPCWPCWQGCVCALFAVSPDAGSSMGRIACQVDLATRTGNRPCTLVEHALTLSASQGDI